LTFIDHVIKLLESKISETKHTLQTLSITRQNAQSELTDLVKSRTELECVIEDLNSAGASSNDKLAELEAELVQVTKQIDEREEELEELVPQWDSQRSKESTEKRNLDEANAKLSALFSKQGRVNRFKTKAERDAFLRHEMASIEAFQKTQTAALASSRTELEISRHSQVEIEEKISGVQGRIEDGRKRIRELGEQSVKFKEEQGELLEKKKDLWREDTKLESLVKHAKDELQNGERNLASMMDKV
jgi:structural maintenance of chromosome 3 (chondroitin sulfate proteoglycan 6)